MRSLGRSLAFASGGFIAFAGVSSAIRSSIEAASDAAVTQKQLAAQFKATGANLGDYQKQIDRTSARLSALSGFTTEDLTKAFTGAFRATRSVADALKIEAVAADVARGRHIALGTAQIALSKAAAGSATALKRLGIILPANVKGMDAVVAAGRRFAGQAESGTTAQQRFSAALHNSEVIIGSALLPTVVRLADRLAAYLTKLNETGRLQKDVNSVVKTATGIVHGLEGAFTAIKAVVVPVNDLLGGTKHTVELLTAALIAFKLKGVAAFVIGMAQMRAAATVGAAASGAAGGAAAGAGAGLATGALADLAIGPGAIAAGGAALLILQHKAQALAEGVAKAQERSLAGTRAEAILVPKLAEDFLRMKRAGVDTADAVARLKQNLGGSLAAADLLAKALIRASRPPDALGRVVESGRVKGVFTGFADPRRRAPLSLQGRLNLLELQLAKAQLTASQKDDRAILVQEARLVKQKAEKSKILKDRTALYQQLAQIDGQILAIDQTAAQKQTAARAKAAERARKAREAARKVAEKAREAAATFTIPARLQLAEARAEALAALHPTATGGPTQLELNIARRIKAAALKALASGKKTIQGQIDAWNAIAQANATLAQGIKTATGPGSKFHKASASALIAEFGLTGDAARAFRAALAGVGPGGTVAGSGSGAFGFAVPTNDIRVELDGHQVARSVTVRQDRTRRRNPPQKRGPHAK